MPSFLRDLYLHFRIPVFTLLAVICEFEGVVPILRRHSTEFGQEVVLEMRLVQIVNDVLLLLLEHFNIPLDVFHILVILNFLNHLVDNLYFVISLDQIIFLDELCLLVEGTSLVNQVIEAVNGTQTFLEVHFSDDVDLGLSVELAHLLFVLYQLLVQVEVAALLPVLSLLEA